MRSDRRFLMTAGALSLAGAAVDRASAQPVAARPLTPAEAVKDAPDPAEVIPLWPKGAPGGKHVTVKEVVDPRTPPPGMRDRSVSGTRNPTLTVWRPAKPNGVALILAPGGGYARVVKDKEGAEVSRYFASRGYTCFVLLYRLPGDGWTAGPNTPLQDSQRAIRLVRAGAKGFGIDPNKVVIMGFSAGGHMAGSLMTRHDAKVYDAIDAADSQPTRPDAACLCYPVIALTGPLAHLGSANNLLGQNPSEAAAAAVSIETRINAQTPPAILFHAADDTTVPVGNSLTVFSALHTAKVESELHVFAHGQHGFSIRGALGKPAEKWPELLHDWLQARGL